MSEEWVPLNAVDRHVGMRMQTRRRELKITPLQFIELVPELSLKELMYHESGAVRIGFERLLKVAKVLKVPERYFYQGFGPGIPPALNEWYRPMPRKVRRPRVVRWD